MSRVDFAVLSGSFKVLQPLERNSDTRPQSDDERAGHTSSPGLGQQTVDDVVVGVLLGDSRVLHQLLFHRDADLVLGQESLQLLKRLNR